MSESAESANDGKVRITSSGEGCLLILTLVVVSYFIVGILGFLLGQRWESNKTGNLMTQSVESIGER